MPDLPLPLTFRAELIGLIAEAIGAGESCALVGVGSSGKSNVVRFLRDRDDARRHYFGDQARRLLWLMVDCNAVDSFDELGLCSAMLDTLARAVAGRSDLASLAEALNTLSRETQAAKDGSGAYHNLYRGLEQVRAAGDFKFAFVLDDCDKLIQVAPPSLLRRLRALRDDFKYRLVYLTVTRRELHRLRPHSAEFESFFEIMVVRSFAIGPYTEADARFMLDRLGARLPQPRALSAAEARALVQATGGHGGLLKAAFFATRAGEDALDADLIGSLSQSTSMLDECRKIWDSIEPEDQVGLAAAAGGQAAMGEARNALMAKGLVFERTDGTHAVFSPVFENYARAKAGLSARPVGSGPDGASSTRPDQPADPQIIIYQGSHEVRIGGRQVPMTRAEFEVLCLLYEHRGQPLRREDLLQRTLEAETHEPSGLGKTVDGVLDVAVLELKHKLEAGGFGKPAIVGVKGGGYKMTPAA